MLYNFVYINSLVIKFICYSARVLVLGFYMAIVKKNW